jgi:hypothetical protein
MDKKDLPAIADKKPLVMEVEPPEPTTGAVVAYRKASLFAMDRTPELASVPR